MTSDSKRPISPHLDIYGWQISMFTSTMHRITGIGLAIGSIYVAVWLCAAAWGPGTYAAVNGIAEAWYGQVLMVCWTLAVFFHLCNGIRHLLWDTGVGLELDTARTTGYTVIGVTIVLTAIVWIVASFV